MKKAIIVSSALAIILSGCFKPQPIKIGFIATLTGKSSELGIGARTGVRIAVNELNSSGGINGKPVELIIVDDKSSVEGGIAALDSLKKADVSIVLGPFTSNMTPVVDTGMARGFLFVSPTMSSSALSKANDLFVRLIPTCTDQSNLIVKEITKRDYQSILVLIDENNAAFSGDVWNWIETFAKQNGTESRYRMEKLNLRSPGRSEQLVQIIDSLKADAVVVVANGIDFGVAAQAIRKSSTPFTLYGSRWSTTPDMLINGGKSVEGALFAANIFSKNRTDSEEKFCLKYKAVQGQDPSFIAMFSYDAATVLFNSLSKQNRTYTPSSVRDSILSGKTYPALQGTVTIDSLGDAKRDIIELLTVKNGELILWQAAN